MEPLWTQVMHVTWSWDLQYYRYHGEFWSGRSKLIVRCPPWDQSVEIEWRMEWHVGLRGERGRSGCANMSSPCCSPAPWTPGQPPTISTAETRTLPKRPSISWWPNRTCWAILSSHWKGPPESVWSSSPKRPNTRFAFTPALRICCGLNNSIWLPRNLHKHFKSFVGFTLISQWNGQCAIHCEATVVTEHYL